MIIKSFVSSTFEILAFYTVYLLNQNVKKLLIQRLIQIVGIPTFISIKYQHIHTRFKI